MKKLSLNPLPYNYEALEPVIDRKTMELHHDKHHATYVNAYNALTELPAWNREAMRDLSFNYNGAILHDIFWQNMRTPTENNLPPEGMFTDFEKFKTDFSAAAVTVEGSGWAVLWKDNDKNLVIGQLEKHNLLGLSGMVPILVLDVWEHAYYLNYQNNRKSYVENWWQVVNWSDVAKRFQG